MSKQIILNSTKTYNIIIEEISEELNNRVDNAIKDKLFVGEFMLTHIENDTIVNSLPCFISHIYAIGTTNELTESQIAKFIPSKNSQKNNFMCYSKKNFSSDPTCIIHDSATSSLFCVLELLKKPKYIIIYRKNKDDNKPGINCTSFKIEIPKDSFGTNKSTIELHLEKEKEMNNYGKIEINNVPN